MIWHRLWLNQVQNPEIRNEFCHWPVSRPQWTSGISVPSFMERKESPSLSHSSTTCHGLPLPAMTFHSLPRHSTACHCLPRPSTAFHGLSRPSTAFYGLPQSSTVCHSLSWPSTAFHSLPWPDTAFHSLSQPFTVFQGLPQPATTFYSLSRPVTTCHRIAAIGRVRKWTKLRGVNPPQRWPTKVSFRFSLSLFSCDLNLTTSSMW